MSEQNSLDQAENDQENDTLENESEETVEDLKEGDDEKQEPQSDYAEELAAIKAKAEKQQDIIDKKNRAIGKLKKERNELRDSEIGDDVMEKVLEKVDQRYTAFEQKIQQDKIEDLVSQYSTREDEAELIRYHLKNSIKSTGDVKEDVELAAAIANRKRLVRESKEKAEAQKVRSMTEKTISVAGQKVRVDQGQKLNAKERKLLANLNKAIESRNKYL